MKFISLCGLLTLLFMARAGSYCHISHDEIDPVLTNTFDADLVSEEDMQDFLDDFEVTITTSAQEFTDEQTNKDKQSLRARLLFTIQKLAVTCMIKMHYAGEWLKEKWATK